MSNLALWHEHEIVAAARTGTPGAFAELYVRYSRRLYNAIVAITKNREDAEDALQDTFIRALSAIHTFEGRASFYSWLTRIAVNSALLVLRKRRIRAEISFDPMPDFDEVFVFDISDRSPNPEQVCDMRQRHLRVQCALRDLKPGLREPIRMQLAHEASMKDISRTLNISEGAVKARLHRARARLVEACREP